MDTVLFTGAGASRAIGYPLTSELLPEILRQLEHGTLFKDTNGRQQDAQDRDDLRGCLLALVPGLNHPDAKLPLITDLFSLVEYALVTGEALPLGGEDDLRRCRHLLKHAITEVLVDPFFEPWDDENADDVRAQKTLGTLVSMLRDKEKPTGLVTTNYDIGIEYPLYERIGRTQVYETIDLGFDWRHIGKGDVRGRPAEPGLRVYKLHGSLDTLRCPLCGHAYFNPWGVIAKQVFETETSDANTCHCRDEQRLEPHIVPPCIIRDRAEANLMSVWRSAFECMRKAKRWILIGYSLPPEDLAVRSLLVRSFSARKKPPEIIVVQKGGKARPAYKALFPKCRYFSDGLESFLGG